MHLILASSSPRRAELLRQIGLSFTVIPSCLNEGEPVFPLTKWVEGLSLAKARAVQAKKSEIVLAADTIVHIDGRVLGKPDSIPQAREMLRSLSGRKHQVITGICIIYDDKIYQDFAVTDVYFRELKNCEIDAYSASGEPLDKAGAYGIQGMGSLLVERIDGCYYNVMGLPLTKTMNLLRKCGVMILGKDK